MLNNLCGRYGTTLHVAYHPYHVVEYMTLTSHHLPAQTHDSTFRLTLSNFFGEYEEIQSKLYNIVLILLLGAKLFSEFNFD